MSQHDPVQQQHNGCWLHRGLYLVVQVVKDVHLLELPAVAYLIKQVRYHHSSLFLHQVPHLRLEVAQHVAICKEFSEVVHCGFGPAVTASETTSIVLY